MFVKKILYEVVIGVLCGLCVFSLNSEAREHRGGIRVIGSNHDISKPTPEIPCNPGRINHGKGRANPKDATSCLSVYWDKETLFLQGVIAAVNETSLSILDGGLTIDISEADVEYKPFVHYRGPHQNFNEMDATEDEWVVETGQHAFIQAEVVEIDGVSVLKATKVRVMDFGSHTLDSNEGGIRGVLDSFDLENGLAVVAGIPIRMDESTIIRSRIKDGDVILPGDLAGVHVIFIDTDENGVSDSFYAERISICKIRDASDASVNGN